MGMVDKNAFSYYINYLNTHGVKVELHNGYYLFSDGTLINMDYTDFGIDYLINNPPRKCIINDTNCIFSPSSIERKDAINKKFHYIEVCSDYFSSLDRKKRWKFKNELHKEGDVSIEEVGIDKEFILLFQNRIKELNGKESYENKGVTVYLRNTNKEVHYYKIIKSTLIGVAATVETDPGVTYCIIFNSIEPCVYSFTNYLVNRVKGIIHFGASESINSNFTPFLYKKNISNNWCWVNYYSFIDNPSKHSLLPFYSKGKLYETYPTD